MQQGAETTTVEGLPLVDAGFNPREIPQGGQQIDGSGDLRNRPGSSDLLRPTNEKGERTPPSSIEPLRPFIPPFHRYEFGPLSEK